MTERVTYQDWDLASATELSQAVSFFGFSHWPDFSFTFTAIELEYIINEADAAFDVGRIYENKDNCFRLRELEESCFFLDNLCRISAEHHGIDIEDDFGDTTGAFQPASGTIIATPICFSFAELNPNMPQGIVPVVTSLTRIHDANGGIRTGELVTPMRGCVIEPHFPSLN